MLKSPVRAVWPLLLGTLVAATEGAPVPRDVEVIAFVHLHRNERVGVTRIDFDPGGLRCTERFALAFPLAYRPLGTYADATFAFDGLGRLAGYRFAAVAGGHYRMRRAEIQREGAAGRPVLVEDPGPATAARGAAPPPRRIPLPKGAPLLLFDPNLIAPLVRFGRGRHWRDTFDALRQASPLGVIRLGDGGEARSESTFWIKRTARARVEVDDRTFHCTVYALHLGDRDVLISLCEASGELLRIEEPALGYEIRRTFATVPAPKPQGLGVVEAFRDPDRLAPHHAPGIALDDRGALAEVEYAVDLPGDAAATPPPRPWQAVTAGVTDGRLRGTIRVRAAAERPAVVHEPPPPVAAGAEPPACAPAIRALAGTLHAAAPRPFAYLEAVIRHTAEEIGLVHDVHTSDRAVATGFGSARAKVQLAADLLGARGLPTREVGGLLFTGRAFVRHRWIEVYLAEHTGWVPADPVLGEAGALSALHLTLGAPWPPPEPGSRCALRTERYRFRPGPAGKRDRVHWPDGEARVYGFYNRNDRGESTLYGYLASRPDRRAGGEIQLQTDLIIDLARLGATGYLRGEATALFDGRGGPRWFSFQTWLGGKRATTTVRVTGDHATLQETDRPARHLRFAAHETDVVLAADSFYDHWALFFAALDPAATDRMTLYALRPAGERVYRWTLIRRDRARIEVPGLESEVDAWVFDLVEWGLRFWVTEGRVLARTVHTPSGTEIRLERPSIRERF